MRISDWSSDVCSSDLGTPCGSRWRQAMTMIAYAPVLLLLLVLLVSAIKVLREYERGVVFQLGRYWKVKGPGLIILIPVVQQMVRIDLRTIVMDVPEQAVTSRANVSGKVNAAVSFRVYVSTQAL